MIRLLSLCLLAASAAGLTAQDAKVLKVCLISGSFEYESDKCLAKLQTMLESKYRVKCSLVSTKKFEELPGLEKLDDCDVAVLFTRRLKLTGEQLERIKKYCTSGKPLVGIRTASHGIQSWLELDKEVFGGDYKNHFGAGITKIESVAKSKYHPILAGFKSFGTEGTLYKNANIAKDCDVLLTGTSKDATMPVAWTRMYKGGRIFYTSLGHQSDFDNAVVLQLLANAIYWTANQTPALK